MWLLPRLRPAAIQAVCRHSVGAKTDENPAGIRGAPGRAGHREGPLEGSRVSGTTLLPGELPARHPGVHGQEAGGGTDAETHPGSGWGGFAGLGPADGDAEPQAWSQDRGWSVAKSVDQGGQTRAEVPSRSLSPSSRAMGSPWRAPSG